MNYSSPQGLASLGRNGDSMLVHMSPEEVQGLQGLAMAQGGSLTINPDTGLPEAFKLKNVFKSALPIAAGFMFPGFGTKIMGGMLGKGIAAGALTGAGIAALSGDNVLMGGLTGALGGYGGAGLAGSAGKVGALKGAGAGAETAARTTAEANLANMQNISPFTPTGVAGTQAVSPALTSSAAGTAVPGSLGYDPTLALDELSGAVSPNSAAYLNAAPTSPFVSQTPGLNTSTLGIKEIPSGLGQATSGGGGYAGELGGALQTAGENFGTLMKNPLDVMGDYGYGSSAMLVGGPLVAGLEPSDLGYGPGPIYNDPDKGKYRGSQGQLNLGDNFDTGLRLIAKGGEIKSYALGGNVGNPSVGGGLSSLYNRPEGQIPQNISSDAYGLGRLSDLGSEQARFQAQTLGYADGGYLNGDGDGMSDSIPATIEGKQPARLADGEFVIPADVVSHLGNGSSKAGSKRLYAMLDKVRHARTGNKKQGKEIKAEKYLLA
jgi:hypothetical protein